MSERDTDNGGSERRWCDDCEDYTPQRMAGDTTEFGREYQCLACPERVEIEAALDIGDRSPSTESDQ